jgi:ribosomal protein L31
MKTGIHPDYQEVKVTCSCGNTFTQARFVGGSLLGLPSVLYREAEDR